MHCNWQATARRDWFGKFCQRVYLTFTNFFSFPTLSTFLSFLYFCLNVYYIYGLQSSSLLHQGTKKNDCIIFIGRLPSRSLPKLLWPHLRCDVGLEAGRRVAELFLCVVHCNVYCCIIMLHNSTSSSNRSVDMICSISFSLALSSNCLCNFLYLWHYIILQFVLLSFL